MPEPDGLAANWRDLPAAELAKVLNEFTGTDLPTRAQLEEIAARFYFQVQYADNATVPTALTFHKRRVILIPHGKPDRMHTDLFHEVAELLLRRPVAPEFHHELTGNDEFHNVASLTTHQLRERIRAERDRLLETEIELETSITNQRAEIKQMADGFIAFGQALQAGQDIADLAIPDRAAMQSKLSALTHQTTELKRVQAKLRC